MESVELSEENIISNKKIAEKISIMQEVTNEKITRKMNNNNIKININKVVK